MMRKRTSIAAGIALTAALGLAACGSQDMGASNGSPGGGSMTTIAPSQSGGSGMNSPSGSMGSSSPSMGSSESMSPGGSNGAAMAQFGPGCSQVPTSGSGSFEGMSKAPVATAASHNPLLSTLVAAVSKAGLVDTLNSPKDVTVFAPANSAFEKVGKETMTKVMNDKKALTQLLTYHVVQGRLSPEQVAGTHKTLSGQTLMVQGSGENMRVGKGKAKVLCGNVQTANATVYIVDGVLMP